MRDKLIHDYLGVDVEVVWRTITDDIPILEKQIKEIDWKRNWCNTDNML